ncbi:hypothetical protein BJX65DRAFT_271005 [Aspergillus insuetus]
MINGIYPRQGNVNPSKTNEAVGTVQQHMRCRLTSNTRLNPNSDNLDNARIQQDHQASSNKNNNLPYHNSESS